VLTNDPNLIRAAEVREEFQAKWPQERALEMDCVISGEPWIPVWKGLRGESL
jgi:hypothetical protein